MVPMLGDDVPPPGTFAVVGLLSAGKHAALVFQTDGEWSLIHLAGHHDFQVQAPDFYRMTWVVPACRSEVLAVVAAMADLVAERWMGSRDIPYGFDSRRAVFQLDGDLSTGGAQGLNCVGLVSAIFEAAGVRLVDFDSWLDAPPTRRAEDLAAHQHLLDTIGAHAGPAWAARAVTERHAPRVRPCEIAAASGMSPLPVDYRRAEPAGRDILDQLAARLNAG